MITKEAIDSALNSHSLWKERLQEAITKGQSEFQVTVVKRDNACQFGKWLYGIPEEEKSSQEYKNIRSLHAEFHRIAGEILELALNGDTEEALNKLESGGSYQRISGRLVLVLNKWRDGL
jgi:methyl-accepting chemotaxis protein